MVEEDVHNHRPQQHQRQRDIATDQQEQATEELEPGDHERQMRGRKRAHKLPGRASRHRSHGDEVEKAIRSENQEHDPKQHASNKQGNFHNCPFSTWRADLPARLKAVF